MQKAKAICDWIVENIVYDHDRIREIEERKDDGIPHHPEVTLEKRMGVCSDMAVLYVSIARKMGLKAYYAHVTVDHKGNNCSHACAVVDLPTGRKLADPAYGKFDIHHKKYTIYEPKMKWYDGRIVEASIPIMQALKPVWKYVASLLLAGSAFSGIASLVSCDIDDKGIKRLEHECGSKFISQNGVLEFNYDRETAKILREYIFFCEAMEGTLSDKRILEKYLEADKDRDSHISTYEANSTLQLARNEYYKRKL